MSAVAGGMESDSDSDSDMVFSSQVHNLNNNKKSYHNIQKDSESKSFSSCNSSERSYRDEKDLKSHKPAMIPNSVMRRKNMHTSKTYNRQRVHRNKCLVFDDLRYAILQGNMESTRNLYESNDINVDTILKSGWTGLMYACSVGHADITKYLLQRGADPNFHHDMFTPLMAVCISKKDEENLLKCCSLLLEYEANVNVYERHHTTALIFAAREGHVNIVKLLLEHEANADMADSRGYTALAWAAYFGRGQVIRVLLEKGANRNKANNMGQLPADIAYDHGYTEIASVLQKIQTQKDESIETLASSLPNKDKKTVLDSMADRHFESSKKFTKFGDLDLFLIGIGCQDLLPKFSEHHLGFHDLLIMGDSDLEKIGIYQVGLRNKILEACKAVHKKEWQNSSLPNLKRNHYISCPDAVSMVANISKHLKYISTSVIYVRNQIQSQPRILELSKEGANIHNLLDEVEDSLKNLHSLKDEMRFLKVHLIKLQDKPEYNSGDLIVEAVSKDRYTKAVVTAVGITTVSLILASIWWKYPGVLNSLQPSIFIRIPFSK